MCACVYNNIAGGVFLFEYTVFPWLEWQLGTEYSALTDVIPSVTV